MPKLTPTFNDLAQGGNGAGALSNPRITHEHEPLGEGAWQVPNLMPVGPHESIQEHETLKADKPLRVALIGTAPSSRSLAPYADPAWEIWGCSPGNMNQLPKVDAWFELHANLMWPENAHYGQPYINWLKSLTIPLYMQDKTYCENAIPFPKDELVREFGRCFFTSSFAWMMAFAMLKGAKEIALFGIDMASRDEYIQQRQGAYYFFHEGQRRGCKMWAPAESDIMQAPPLYGYADATPYGRKMHTRRKEIQDRISAMEAEERKVHDNITYLKGALEDNDYQIQIWGGAQSA